MTTTTPTTVNEALAAGVAAEASSAASQVPQGTDPAEREANELLAEQFPGIAFDVRFSDSTNTHPRTGVRGLTTYRGALMHGTVDVDGTVLHVTAFRPTAQPVAFVELSEHRHTAINTFTELAQAIGT